MLKQISKINKFSFLLVAVYSLIIFVGQYTHNHNIIEFENKTCPAYQISISHHSDLPLTSSNVYCCKNDEEFILLVEKFFVKENPNFASDFSRAPPE